MSSTARARVAVLLSGRGSNYRALQEAVDQRRLPAEIVAVVSNEPEAAGLEIARAAGVPAHAIPHRGEPSRASHEEKVRDVLERAGAEWICLAGYMRLLSEAFVDRYRWRVLNVHPSLLPAFPGLDVHRKALEHGVRISGCTVHLVDAGLDSGPIVVQRAVPVLDDDTPESLAARILEQEHRAYPEALERLLTRRWVLEGRRLRFRP